MIHPLRPFASKYQAATHYIEAGLDFFEKGKERWSVPRVEPAPIIGPCSEHGREGCPCRAGENDHTVAYTDDVLRLEAEGVILGIIPGSRPETGYLAVIRTRLIHSHRNWFQPSGYLSDESYVSFHRIMAIRQYNGGLINCMPLLRRTDTGKPRWENIHILLDDSGLGSMESGPFKALASEAQGRFIPLAVLLNKVYKVVESGSKDVMAVGAAQMLADLRNVVAQKRMDFPEEIKNSPLGKVLSTQLQSSTNRGGDGSLKLAGRNRGEYEPDTFGLLYAVGLAVSYAEITGYRMIPCRLG